MGVTKTQVFTHKQNRVADLDKALAHSARIAIRHLLKEKSFDCGDLVVVLPFAHVTVSMHL